jgi:hypothetical protein
MPWIVRAHFDAQWLCFKLQASVVQCQTGSVHEQGKQRGSGRDMKHDVRSVRDRPITDRQEMVGFAERINVFRASNGHHRAHIQQPIGVGEERVRGRRLRIKDSREEISAFRAEDRA